MATHIPPELMTPEQRGARAGEVQHHISREWLRFALTEVLVLWIPFALFLALYAFTDAISDSWLVPVVVVGVAISAVLVTYWLLRRIMPLQKELEALR